MKQVVYYLEDAGHERLVRALVARLIREKCPSVEWRDDVRVGYGKGGTLRQLREFVRDSKRAGLGSPDVLVVVVDGDCNANQTRSDVVQAVASAPFSACAAFAIPDPHIERWYLADPAALQRVVDAPGMPALPAVRCRKDLFKDALRNYFISAGILAPLGGVEYDPEIVREMDLYRAGMNDRSLSRFIRDVRVIAATFCP